MIAIKSIFMETFFHVSLIHIVWSNVFCAIRIHFYNRNCRLRRHLGVCVCVSVIYCDRCFTHSFFQRLWTVKTNTLRLMFQFCHRKNYFRYFLFYFFLFSSVFNLNLCFFLLFVVNLYFAQGKTILFLFDNLKERETNNTRYKIDALT